MRLVLVLVCLFAALAHHAACDVRILGTFTGNSVNNMGVYASQAVRWHDASVVVLGQFSHVDGVLVNGVAVLNGTTGRWLGLKDSSTGKVGVSGSSGRILASTALTRGSDLFVGGWFDSAGGQPNTQGIARYSQREQSFTDLDGGLQSFDTNLECWEGTETPYVSRLYQSDYPEVVAAIGRFRSGLGLSATGWDADIPGFAPIGHGVSSDCDQSKARNFVEVDWVTSATVVPDWVYVMGEFTHAVQFDGTSLAAGGIARFNRNSGQWELVDQGLGGYYLCADQTDPIDWVLHTQIFLSRVADTNAYNTWISGPVVPFNQTEYQCSDNHFAAYRFFPELGMWQQMYEDQLNTRSRVAIFTSLVRHFIAPSDAVKLTMRIDHALQNANVLTKVISSQVIRKTVYITGFTNTDQTISTLVSIPLFQ